MHSDFQGESMAGKRMLHANILESRKLSKISYAAEALYYRLLMCVDDNGNYYADPDMIKGKCLSLRKQATVVHVRNWMKELTENGNSGDALLTIFEQGGEKYFHFNRFESFQYLRKDIPPKGKYPENPPKRYALATASEEDATPRSRDVNGTATACKTPSETPLRPVTLSKVKVSEDKERESKLSSLPNEGFDFGKLKRKYQNIVGKMPSSTNANVEMYGKFCLQYGEANVLKWFEIWAPDRKDYIRGSKGNNGIGLFWKDIPDFAKAAEEAGVTASGKEEENSPEDDRPPTYDPIKHPLRSTKVPLQ
jgi:hypothetical protein